MSELQSSTDSTETIKIPKTKPIVLVNEESSPGIFFLKKNRPLLFFFGSLSLILPVRQNTLFFLVILDFFSILLTLQNLFQAG